jgi:pSer/pThr/pTyr-binding forkhead associated (FHA) protein
MPALQVFAGPHAGTLIPLIAQTVVLGRGPHCDILIPIAPVSRNHSRIVRDVQTYFLEDANSRSGTFLNDAVIGERVALNNLDRIGICNFIAVYLDEPFGGLPDAIEALELDQGTVAAVLVPSHAMTEQEWLISDEPSYMLESLSAIEGTHPTLSLNFPRGPALHRKLRLFVWACARRIWHILDHPVAEESVEVAERYAEGAVADSEREHAYKQEMQRRGMGEPFVSYYAYRECSNAEHHAARTAARAVEAVLGRAHRKHRANERVVLASLLRDLFLPFRHV